MSLRFLATGDLQIHPWRQFSYTMKNGMNSRLYNCLKVLDIILEEAKKRKISNALIDGDVFEENSYIDVEVYDATYRKFEKLHQAGLEVALNLGNHDILLQSPKRVLHSLRPFRRITKLVESPERIWGCLQVVPYTADPERTKKIIRSLKVRPGDGLVLHCGVQGARTGPTSYLVRNPIKLRDIRKEEFAVVLLSDYHTSQSLSKNVFYLGSPLQHTFGETHRPCIWDMVLDGHSYTAEKIYTNLPRFKTVDLGRHNDSGLKKLKLLEGKLRGQYVRVYLSAESRIPEGTIERFAEGKFLVQVLRRGREDEEDLGVNRNVHTISPEDAIIRQVAFHTSGEAKAKRLTELGLKIYRGEL